MLQPECAGIPEGCNFVGWFKSACTAQALAEMFQLEGWHAEPTDSGYTLRKVDRFGPTRKSAAFDIQYTLALTTATAGHPNVLSGCIEHPMIMASEIRRLLWSRDGRSNNLVCLWRGESLGRVWRDAPATAESLGLDPLQLSEADRAAISAAYLRWPPPDSQDSSPAAWPWFLVESVVVDDERITFYGYPGAVQQLDWHQVREVGAVGPDSGWSCVPYLYIGGESRSLRVTQGCEGLPVLLNRLAGLPNFPIEKLLDTLGTQMWDGEVTVWKRDDVGPGTTPDAERV